MGSVVNADGVEVWVEEGYGRIGIIDHGFAGLVQLSLSADNGKVFGAWIDDRYKPASVDALVLPAVEELDLGQRIHFRAETTRHVGVDEKVAIRELDENQVCRSLVTLVVVPEGVDEPAPRPAPKTRQIPNAEIVPPPPPRAATTRPKRYGPSHRDGWDYNAVLGCVMFGYNEIGGFDEARIRTIATDVLTVADLAQLHLEDHIDHKSYAHARARGAAFSIIKHHPAPVRYLEQDGLRIEFRDDGRHKGWLVGVALTTIALLRIADDILAGAA